MLPNVSGCACALDHVGERRRQHQHHDEAQEQAQQHPARVPQHPAQEVEPRRIGHELEQPERAEELRRRDRHARPAARTAAGRRRDRRCRRNSSPNASARATARRYAPSAPTARSRAAAHTRRRRRRRAPRRCRRRAAMPGRADAGLRRQDDGADAERDRRLVRDPDRPRPRPLGRGVERLGELLERESHRTPSPDLARKSNFIRPPSQCNCRSEDMMRRRTPARTASDMPPRTAAPDHRAADRRLRAVHAEPQFDRDRHGAAGDRPRRSTRTRCGSTWRSPPIC